MSDTSNLTRLTAAKAGFNFAVWIEVDGREVPIYGISTPKEGPEGFVLSEVGKVRFYHCCQDSASGGMNALILMVVSVYSNMLSNIPLSRLLNRNPMYYFPSSSPFSRISL
jgi:hypothetical protein